MTPSEIQESARNRYNAVGDSNWSDQELYDIIYEGAVEMTRDCGLIIEKKFQLTTTSGTGEYAFPTNANSIKRVTYNGKKLQPIDMRQSDILTVENQLTTNTGEPSYYYVWNRTFTLVPIPNAAEELEVFAVCNEQALTSASSLDIPDAYHPALVNFLLREMSAKDLNWAMYDRYDARWQGDKTRITAHARQQKRGDSFNIVKLEEGLPLSALGLK